MDERSSESRPGGRRWSLGLLGRGESVGDVSRRLSRLIQVGGGGSCMMWGQ
jgi:hypothetical protein